MRKLLRTIEIVFLITVFLTTVSGTFSCGNPGKTELITETVTVAATPIELNALIYIADAKGFFAENGVRVVYKDYDTGVAAVDGMLNGEADIAMTMEFVTVVKSFQKKDILNLANLDKSSLFYIIVRTDRGIKTITDLKGKRIGLPRQTITEFYLGRTLELNGIGINQVTLVDSKASDPAGAIAGGDLDAVVTWEPYVTRIKKQMGDEVIAWPAQSSQLSYWSTVGTRAWINQHSDLVKRYLKALAMAEAFVASHDKDTKAIIKARLNYEDDYINTVWSEHQFSLSLDQSLISAMEDEARWMISNNLTAETQIPDFTKYIYTDALKAVKPEAVNIIK